MDQLILKYFFLSLDLQQKFVYIYIYIYIYIYMNKCGKTNRNIFCNIWFFIVSFYICKVGQLDVLFHGVSTFFGSFNAELNFKQFS